MHCPSAHGRIGGIIPDLQERAAEANYLGIDIIVIHSGKVVPWQVFKLDDKDGFGDLTDSQGP
jgi:hypothetical protein